MNRVTVTAIRPGGEIVFLRDWGWQVTGGRCEIPQQYLEELDCPGIDLHSKIRHYNSAVERLHAMYAKDSTNTYVIKYLALLHYVTLYSTEYVTPLHIVYVNVHFSVYGPSTNSNLGLFIWLISFICVIRIKKQNILF